MSGRIFAADYYDGRTSGRRPVDVQVDGVIVWIRAEGLLLQHSLDELRIHPRLGRTPVRIELPDGGLLVAADADAAGSALPIPKASTLAHRLESHLGAVLVALAGIALAGWFGYRDGIPWAAREIALRLPPAIESELSVEGLAALDRHVFKPTQIAADRQARLRAVFEEIRYAAKADGARLELRNGGWIGANALALPGGVVVLTDQLVELLADDDRIAAVLAHEIGHLQNRHVARTILQDSLVALASMAVMGDASSVAQIATTLPAAVMHASYSRDFEREADSHAYALLRKTGRSPRLLGDALAALEKEHRSGSRRGCIPEPDAASTEDPYPPEDPERRPTELGYLSTHPATSERIRAAEEAAR